LGEEGYWACCAGESWFQNCSYQSDHSIPAIKARACDQASAKTRFG
jgi:hypothetical protein